MKIIKSYFLFSILLSLLFTFSVSYTYTGEGTEYAGTLSSSDGATGYNCGIKYLTASQRKYYVALNTEDYQDSLYCGRCVIAKCEDDKCKSTNSVKTVIVDSCPSCAKGDLDFSLEAWNELTGISPNRVNISWEFTTCNDLLDGETN